MDDQQKDRIGDYELFGLIGDGAQGRVYKARRLPTPGQEGAADAPEELVALKVVRITGEDEKARLKFQEQADILRRLSHPSIVAYRDCFSWHAGEWDESQCLAMELLEGESLHERLLKSSSGLNWPQVEEIFEQSLAGLIHAREMGITHRDIKPSNIFLTHDGRAKLIDFDIARRDDSGQMSTAGFKGTFDYMAPDFITIEGFRGDELSDVFSLGVCFYQALTGSLPFERLGENAHIGYLNRWRDNANPTPSFRPGVFRVLANAKAVVSRCLTSRREQRYQSFAAMLEDFRKIRYRRVRHKDKEDYELLAVLGRGGFGEVFKARRVSDGMLVAVKYLFSEKQSDRFIKEAKILQQYPHPNLVKYVDFMVLDGAAGEKQFFLVMEFLEGMPGWTLRPRLKNEGRLEVAECVALFSTYLSALQFLHENPKPIIHRDIKPGNLYAPVGQPEKGKIFDLGVARDVTGTVTVGGVPGTLDYMAPEFAEAGGDRGSPQSDLYALGLCLYEALAGKPAYDRLPTDLNSAWITFQNRIRNPPPLAFDCPAFTQYPRLKQVLATALALRACDRYRSAADMRTALQAALKPEALEQDGLDGLDDNVEVTMATFSPPGGPQVGPLPAAVAAEPNLPAFQDELGAAGEPVTSGTRAVAAAGMQAAVDAARAGARPSAQELVAELPRIFALHRKRFIGGGIAALLLLGLIFGLRALFSGRDEKAGEPVSLKLPSAAKPAAPQTAPPAEPQAPTPVAAAAQPPSAPPAAEPAAPSLPQSATSDPLFAALRDSLPARITSPSEWSAGELSLARLEAQQAQPWPGLDETGKQRRLDSLRELLAERAAAYIEQRRDAVIALYNAGKDGDSERDSLAAITDQTPLLKRLVALKHAAALAMADAARDASAVRATLADLPERIKQTDSAGALQTLLNAFTKLEQTPDINLSAENVKPVEEAFAAKALVIAQDYAKKAETAYAANLVKDGDAFQRQLKDFSGALAPRFGQAALAPLEQAVAVARQNAENRARQAADLAKAQQELAGRLDTLAGTLPAEGPADAKTVLKLFNALAGHNPAEIKDKAAKDKLDSLLKRCSDSLTALIDQNEPVDTRAERMSAAAECLALPAANTLLGRQADTLRAQLKKQQGLSVLRLTNKFASPISVSSANTAFRQTRMTPEESKIWIMPVSGETLSLSVAIDLGDRNRSRFATLKLPRGGGLNHTLGEAAELADTTPATAPPAAAPAAPPAGGEAASAAATGKAYFELSVIPRDAAVMVDGAPASGRVEVTPGENHQVSASLKGYKTIEQHYRVKPGETRKIDLLLEKEERRSLFGF